jgi:hypothetical protein
MISFLILIQPVVPPFFENPLHNPVSRSILGIKIILDIITQKAALGGPFFQGGVTTPGFLNHFEIILSYLVHIDSYDRYDSEQPLPEFLGQAPHY